MNLTKHIYLHTQALCSQCKQKVQARIIKENEKIYLEKFCPEHKFSKTLLSTDVNWFEESMFYIKPREYPLKSHVDTFSGCPDSCGICSEHQQHTCLPVMEITDKCDLDCPVCLKDFNDLEEVSHADFNFMIDELIASEKSVDVVNISGGEPTTHPGLQDFIKYSLDKGVTQVTVSTNGLNLLKDKNLRKYFKETGTITALQFDGFEKSTYLKLRGRDLYEMKLNLIEIMENEDMNYSLVSTIAKGINDNEISKIADFFFESKALSIMFQPVAFSGSASNMNHEDFRLTIPDVIKELGKSKYIKKNDFNPLPCSHYSCFALSYYLNSGEGAFYSLKDFLGIDDYLNTIANKTLPGLDADGMRLMKDKIYEFWSAADSSNINDNILKRIKNVICEMDSCSYSRRNALNIGMKNMKAIFIHHFMDIHNFDFGRLVKCCNPYTKKDGRLVPICSQNIFNLQ